MIKSTVPWWARIAAKVILSRLPAGYGFWRKMNLFAHGEMQDPSYALQIFWQHAARWPSQTTDDLVILELGPGDSLASAVIGAACGAKHTYLVDAGAFATSDMDVYRQIATQLRARGLTPPELVGVRNSDELLRVCRATYATSGLSALRAIPSASVDFIWSNAVLEHVRRRDFDEHVVQMRRILSDRGICSHKVDLRDHLGGGLNNMRIPSRWWEQEWMARSGFYTNRLRQSEIVRAFESAGFAVDIPSSSCWQSLPLPRAALASEFRALDLRELLVKGFEIVLRPKRAADCP